MEQSLLLLPPPLDSPQPTAAISATSTAFSVTAAASPVSLRAERLARYAMAVAELRVSKRQNTAEPNSRNRLPQQRQQPSGGGSGKKNSTEGRSSAAKQSIAGMVGRGARL